MWEDLAQADLARPPAAACHSTASIVRYGVRRRQCHSTTTKRLRRIWASSVSILQVIPVNCSTGTAVMSTIILPHFSGEKRWDGICCTTKVDSLAYFSFLCFRLADPLSSRFSILKTHCTFDPQHTYIRHCVITHYWLNLIISKTFKWFHYHTTFSKPHLSQSSFKNCTKNRKTTLKAKWRKLLLAILKAAISR